jgi:hypothetical protein
MKKGLSVFTAVTTTLWLLGAAFLAGPAYAVTPADYGLTEGDVVSAWDQAGDPDVYIVNDWGYKRLFLNPVIFGFYGHLGFDKVVQVSPTARDAFGTSGLFRNCETGDEKVYGVETTGEDTGMLHWVNMSGSAAVAEDADFFKKVFCINNNEYNWYSSNGTSFGSDYTALSQVPDYSRTPGETGDVSVSLAPSNPGPRTLTNNAKSVEVLALRFTGSGTVDQLTITRTGAGEVNDWGNVYLYDGVTRLTSGKSINASTGEATFNLDLAISGTKDITVVADESASNAGNIHVFEVSEAGDVLIVNGTAGGSYPISGSVMSFSGAAGGSVTVNKTGSISNPKVGAKKAEISQFKLTTATEAGWVKRIRMINDGDLTDSKITNVVVETLGGEQVATGAMSGDGYLDLDFGDPGYFIAKGNNKTFQVYADLGGKRGETIKFYVELVDTDMYIVGDQFGFGMDIINTELYTSGTSHQLTLQGGDLTFEFSGPTATNVGTDTEDTHFIDYTAHAARDIELKQHKILLCVDQGGDGVYDAADTDFADLEDVKIVDVDSGAILVGAIDGSSFVTASASCPGGIDGLTYTSTDAFDLSADVTRNLALTADVTTANDADDSASELGDADIIKIILESYADQAGASGSLSVAKYTATNKAVLSAQIIPSGDLTSNEMTISASGLTLGLAGTPATGTYVKGTQDVEVAGFTFKAALASAIKVKKVTVTGRTGASNGALNTTNMGSLVNSLELYDGDTGAQINATVVSNTLSSDGKMQFDNLNWNIPAGETKTLLIKANLSTNAVPTNDTFSFDIENTTDVTALDANSSTATVTGSNLNGAATATVAITIASGGTMTVSAAPDAPEAHALYWGETGNEVARFRFTSSNEAFFLEKLTFGASSADSGHVTDMGANVKSVTLEYTNKLGNTTTVTQSMTAGASANFGFSGDSRPYVPKGSSIDLKVMVNMKSKDEGATSTSAGDATSPVWGMRYHDTYNNSQTDGFRAVGEGSGTVLTGGSAGVGNEVDSENMYVYRVYPKFEQVSVAGGEPLGIKDAFKFTITAMGLTDSKLLFDDSAAGSGSIKFEVAASGNSAATTLTPKTYSGSKNYDTSSTIALVGDDPSNYASYTLDFGENDLEIGGGTSKTLAIEVNFSGFLDKSDFFQVRLLNDEAGLVNWVDNSTGSTANPDVASVANILDGIPMNGHQFTKL